MQKVFQQGLVKSSSDYRKRVQTLNRQLSQQGEVALSNLENFLGPLAPFRFLDVCPCGSKGDRGIWFSKSSNWFGFELTLMCLSLSLMCLSLSLIVELGKQLEH